jgi:hypothetical protein
MFGKVKINDPYNTMGNSGARTRKPKPKPETKKLKPQAAARYNALVAKANKAYDRGDRAAYDDASWAAGDIWHDPGNEA